MRSTFIMLTVLPIAVIGLAAYSVVGVPEIADAKVASSGSYDVISPKGAQAIKADIIDPTPSHMTINVKKLANLNVNEEASNFAVYTTSSLPSQCGDFNHLELNYKKPDKYTRVFNVSDHKEVLEAMDKYGCVVMKNIPPKG